MDTNTNRKRNRRRRADQRDVSTTNLSRSESHIPARPSKINRKRRISIQSRPNSDPVQTQPVSGNSLAIAPPIQPAITPGDDICQVSKSIEAVLESKSEARKQRLQAQAQNTRYQNETRRPIVCLAFVLPLLIAYEIGAILLGQPSMRSGIDQWFHQPLYQLGFGGLVVLPLVTVATLITRHHQSKDHWRIRAVDLFGMLIEAIGLGLILFWAANAIHEIAGNTSISAETISLISLDRWLANIVACIGSGIYEELIFRIGLLSLLIIWASKLIPEKKSATVTAAIAVSLLFAALHYSVFNPAGNPFELSSFVFRFFASIVFCILFLFRGFGIAVGAHVAYDVLTQV